MTKEEAIKFFKDHAAWFNDTWSMSPEGKEYLKKFLAAIEAVK
jgi:hypothetical protein